MIQLIAASMIFLSISASANDKIKMYFNNEELTQIIEVYSKASGQKFVVDPSVRGKISIFIQEPIAVEEAFSQLSSALAINGFAISKQGDTMIIKSARNIQRDLIEVSSEKPTLKPERMYTWVYKAKFIPVEDINRDLRILPSKDGELSVNTHNNQLIITDWVSNLHRVSDILKELDRPAEGTFKRQNGTPKK
jgi:type II secretory pathway component GspD/PulD (secretin)